MWEAFLNVYLASFVLFKGDTVDLTVGAFSSKKREATAIGRQLVNPFCIRSWGGANFGGSAGVSTLWPLFFIPPERDVQIQRIEISQNQRKNAIKMNTGSNANIRQSALDP